MDVILLERVPKLGQMGETVSVRNGYARNYLLPKRKALRASAETLKLFDSMRVDLEARNLERRSESEKVAETLNGQTFVAVRQAGDSGQLYGSVSTRDIADLLSESGFRVTRQQVDLNLPIKAIGMHQVDVVLHPEVIVKVTLNVARSADEAARQAAGEDVLARDAGFEFEEDEDEEELLDAEGRPADRREEPSPRPIMEGDEQPIV
jgi:large subunit ribosomal protein L9